MRAAVHSPQGRLQRACVCWGLSRRWWALPEWCSELAPNSGHRLDTQPAELSFFFFFFFLRPYMPTKLANCSTFSRQIKETSGVAGYTARPTLGEAASPWQAIPKHVTS